MIVKPTATGQNFLQKIRTNADAGPIQNLAFFESKLGSELVGGDTFQLLTPYIVGNHSLQVFVDGVKAKHGIHGQSPRCPLSGAPRSLLPAGRTGAQGGELGDFPQPGEF